MNQHREGQDLPQDATPPTGLVVRTGSGIHLVRCGDSIWECALTGRLKRLRGSLPETTICVGDHVALTRIETASSVSGGVEAPGVGYDGMNHIAGRALISEILPRRTTLSRLAPPPWPGGIPRKQLLAVNVDQVVIVMAAVAPPLKITTIDRYLILARQAGISPAVCINKADQADVDVSNTGKPLTQAGMNVVRIRTELEGRGVRVLLTSAERGYGIEELRSILIGKTSVFAGPSGVGKTSLLKRICPGLQGKTLSISSATGKGRHSTTFSSLVDVGDGYVADLPGLRAIGFWSLEEDTVKSEFEDVESIAVRCRFRNCTHTCEPDCAVLEAVRTGDLDERRYREYLKVMGEAAKTHRRQERNLIDNRRPRRRATRDDDDEGEI